MSSRPFFSVVIPTRNRCDMLRLAISSLIKQKFKNFEIIVSDNSDNKQQAINFSYIERLNLKNLTYIKPNEILTMHDNWEFALTHATGLYVGFLIDKTMFRKAALKEVFYLLNQDLSIDIVNYLNGGIEYYPGKLFQYKFQGPVVRDKNASHYFYPKKELERRFSLKTSIREEGDAYVLGKICFGFYSNRLINKIKSLHGRMFFPTSCDYTSCVLALAYASRAIFLKKILLYSINNFSGNGFLSQNKKGHALNFVKSYDPTLNSLSNLPIPQLYSSLHNFCVADYTILNRLKVVDYEINKENFIR
ncbi:MAG: glycosyltransferase family 2 protein, partial [Pseudomonadota bacterium]